MSNSHPNAIGGGADLISQMKPRNQHQQEGVQGIIQEEVPVYHDIGEMIEAAHKHLNGIIDPIRDQLERASEQQARTWTCNTPWTGAYPNLLGQATVESWAHMIPAIIKGEQERLKQWQGNGNWKLIAYQIHTWTIQHPKVVGAKKLADGSQLPIFRREATRYLVIATKYIDLNNEQMIRYRGGRPEDGNNVDVMAMLKALLGDDNARRSIQNNSNNNSDNNSNSRIAELEQQLAMLTQQIQQLVTQRAIGGQPTLSAEVDLSPLPVAAPPRLCKATTQGGQPCKLKPLEGTDYCAKHQALAMPHHAPPPSVRPPPEPADGLAMNPDLAQALAATDVDPEAVGGDMDMDMDDDG